MFLPPKLNKRVTVGEYERRYHKLVCCFSEKKIVRTYIQFFGVSSLGAEFFRNKQKGIGKIFTLTIVVKVLASTKF